MFMIHNLMKSVVCSAASSAFSQIKNTMSHYFQLVSGESKFGEAALHEQIIFQANNLCVCTHEQQFA